jgi:hypothetical protein
MLGLPVRFEPPIVISTTIQANICQLPTAPIFTTQSGSTSADIVPIDGTTSADTSVTVSVNGQKAIELTSSSSGVFDLELELVTGVNRVTAQASNACGSRTSPEPTVITYVPPASGTGSQSSPTQQSVRVVPQVPKSTPRSSPTPPLIRDIVLPTICVLLLLAYWLRRQNRRRRP